MFVLVLAGLLSGGFLLAEELGGSPPEGVVVKQINANLMRVRVAGQWEELPLMPLADHLCRSNNRLFHRYCGEDVVAPETDQ